MRTKFSCHFCSKSFGKGGAEVSKGFGVRSFIFSVSYSKGSRTGRRSLMPNISYSGQEYFNTITINQYFHNARTRPEEEGGEMSGMGMGLEQRL